MTGKKKSASVTERTPARTDSQKITSYLLCDIYRYFQTFSSAFPMSTAYETKIKKIDEQNQ